MASVVIGSLIPLKTFKSGKPNCTVTIYVRNIENFHSEITFPITDSGYDWRSHIPLAQYFSNPNEIKYLSFGWGDEVFYRTGSRDIKTITQALFWPTPSILHVTGRATRPHGSTPDDAYKALHLSQTDYLRMTQKLKRSFKLNARGNIKAIEPGLVRNSYFFAANGNYHLFHTCNHWIADLLQAGHIITPLVPISPQSILYWAKSDCAKSPSSSVEQLAHIRHLAR